MAGEQSRTSPGGLRWIIRTLPLGCGLALPCSLSSGPSSTCGAPVTSSASSERASSCRIRHEDALSELAEEVTGAPQVEDGPDESEHGNAKPHPKGNVLMIHRKPPGLVLLCSPAIGAVA